MTSVTAASENEYDDLAEDLPKLSDPFIQKYYDGRKALITQEEKQRSDHVFRQSLSPTAIEACAVVAKIRAEERDTIWNPKHEDGSAAKEGAGPLFPGVMFSLAKERMEKTKLWKIVEKMPKGALLHAHMDAMVDLDFLFARAFETKGIYMTATGPLDSEASLKTTSISFTYSKSHPHTESLLWSTSYKPSSLVPIAEAASTFPNGGKEGFLTWLTSRCTITPTEALNRHHGIDAVWEKFTSVFPIIDSLLFYEPIYRACIRRMLSDLHADGIRWVDLRLAFMQPYRRRNSPKPDEGYDEMIRTLGEEIESFKASPEGAGFWGARMIWTTVRRLPTQQVLEDMLECLLTKQQYPHLIAGYDLVGQEDAGRPLSSLIPELFWFRKRCAEENLEIPFFFHAGECLGFGDATDTNLFDALLLGTRRIGHGFSLYKHPLLCDMAKERKILIEACPISEEVLGLTDSILSSPIPALLARGIPISLCNDDPTILGQGKNGNTHDFWQALQGWESLGLEGLASLAENSVRWAAFEDQSQHDWLRDIKDASLGKGIKAERMKIWAAEWEQFCAWVVDEFGDDKAGSEP